MRTATTIEQYHSFRLSHSRFVHEEAPPSRDGGAIILRGTTLISLRGGPRNKNSGRISLPCPERHSGSSITGADRRRLRHIHRRGSGASSGL